MPASEFYKGYLIHKLIRFTLSEQTKPTQAQDQFCFWQNIKLNLAFVTKPEYVQQNRTGIFNRCCSVCSRSQIQTTHDFFFHEKKIIIVIIQFQAVIIVQFMSEKVCRNNLSNRLSIRWNIALHTSHDDDNN